MDSIWRRVIASKAKQLIGHTRDPNLPRTNKYKWIFTPLTEKKSPQKPRKSPTTHGKVVVTVINFTCTLLLREYILLLCKKKGFQHRLWSEYGSKQGVFVILKQATPSKSGPVQPQTQRAPQNPHNTGPLTLHKLAYTFPVPQ